MKRLIYLAFLCGFLQISCVSISIDSRLLAPVSDEVSVIYTIGKWDYQDKTVVEEFFITQGDASASRLNNRFPFTFKIKGKLFQPEDGFRFVIKEIYYSERFEEDENGNLIGDILILPIVSRVRDKNHIGGANKFEIYEFSISHKLEAFSKQGGTFRVKCGNIQKELSIKL